MKIIVFTVSFILFSINSLMAQQFIKQARIEYEVRNKIEKNTDGGIFDELMNEKMPDFMTTYYTNTFSNNKSIYKFERWGDEKIPGFLKEGVDENIWFTNFNSDQFAMQKNFWGNNILVSDSIPKLKWKLENENRMIAGFNCRKAVAVIFDSVYVFAFYTEEITFSGGPQSLNGLPGMILGVTIPRLSTSWIATKVMLNDVNENDIKLPKAKKEFKFYDLKKLIEDRTKDWNSDDEKENKRIQEQKAKQFWSINL
ncbi:MAG: GLPGLI family protein [Ginsengibacter sp.]